MGWKIEQAKKWTDFVNLVNKLGIGNSRYQYWCFRGQANASWELQPSLLRWLQMGNIKLAEALAIEERLKSQFMSKAHLYLVRNAPKPKTNLAWWMLMQHYSCPTRLLDWSYSPYVAAYFAVEREPNSDGAIWIYNSEYLRDKSQRKRDNNNYKIDEDDHVLVNNEVFNDTGSVCLLDVFNTAWHTERSSLQQGCFSVSTYIFGNHGNMLETCYRNKCRAYPLLKYIIPAELKYDFFSQLRIMNITAETLFPGIDGLGRSAAEYVKIQALKSMKNNNLLKAIEG